MKKLFLSVGTIAIAITPFVVIGCVKNEDKETGNHYPVHNSGNGYYVGPRGGTFHYTSSGHRSYSGHTSNYHHH